ncbi:MAG: cyclic nucleotide-binding and patatin-like phospholipase domain-containing protein [Planctomycetota bacterium]
MPPDVVLECLRECGACEGIGEDEIRRVAGMVEYMAFQSGSVIYRQGDPADAFYIIVRGRVRLILERVQGNVVLNYLGPGNHFGEIALLTSGPRINTVATTMHTDVLRLPREAFWELMQSIPGFAANISRSLGMLLRGVSQEVRRSSRAAVVALVGSSPFARSVVFHLAGGLAAKKRKVTILTDRMDFFPPRSEFTLLRLPEADDVDERLDKIREQITLTLKDRDYLLVDLAEARLDSDLPALLMLCEEIFWLAERADWEATLDRVRMFVRHRPMLSERLHWLWVQRRDDGVVPLMRDPPAMRQPVLQLVLHGRDQHTTVDPASLSRLANHVMGKRIGLALGGGGAKGMAHIGVLDVLTEAGIYFDMVAGCSVGSLIGLFHASGVRPERLLELVDLELVPRGPWLATPWSKQLFFWWMFRTGGWERKLRHYFHRVEIEQLPLPFHPVSVDLIRGESVVRESGDAVRGVLESINFPVIAKPILRQGQALVDGGVLNNVPANALRDRGMDLVVAVDIMSKMSMRYGKNRPNTRTKRMRYPGLMETIFRLFEIQQHGLVRAEEFHVLISPDTSGFSFFDFSKAARLAERGREAALAVLPELKAAIDKLYEPS